MPNSDTASADTRDSVKVSKARKKTTKVRSLRPVSQGYGSISCQKSTVQKRKARKQNDVPSERPKYDKRLALAPPETEGDSVEGDSALHFDILNRPNGKWRALGIHINFHQTLDKESVDAVQNIAYREFYNYYPIAVESERERVEKRQEQIRNGANLKRPTSRPTDKALGMMVRDGKVINQAIRFGYVPGVTIGDQFEYKVQLKAVGIHRHPLGGIDYVGEGAISKDSPPLAVLPFHLHPCIVFQVSVVLSGGYQDDSDDGTHMVYTGQGGNDMLGQKKQTADQKLIRGTLALLNNAEYGIPVRVTKRNGDRFIYDGLWDVLCMIKTKGTEGFIVYMFRMTRCPGQVSSNARQVRFREGANVKPAIHSLPPVGEICNDFARGANRKPISVVNDVDDDLPPGLTIDDLTPEAKNRKQWKASPQSFVFGSEMKYDVRVIRPNVPQLPASFQATPHDYLLTLNHGSTPSSQCSLSSGFRSLPYQRGGLVHHAMCILHECGDWVHCKKGKQCDQSMTSRPPEWKFQVFKTKDRGWGVRTLTRIPSGSFVMKYIGEVYRAEDVEEDDDYSYDMTERPDFDEENKWLSVPRAVESKHVVTGKRYGNLFRFVNHSCNPSCFVQPVLGHHLDRTQPDVCIFAMREIVPGEELSYDYGRAYIEQRMKICRCGSACCDSRNLLEMIEV